MQKGGKKKVGKSDSRSAIWDKIRLQTTLLRLNYSIKRSSLAPLVTADPFKHDLRINQF